MHLTGYRRAALDGQIELTGTVAKALGRHAGTV